MGRVTNTLLRRVRRFRRRALIAALATLVLPAPAAAQVDIRNVDASGYPTVRTTVVTGRVSPVAPTLSEGGQLVTGARAENLGRAKSIALLIDQSKSMKGKPFGDAVAAARAFISSKPVEDRISVVSFGVSAVKLTGFSTATIDADTALRTLGVDTETGTALYDAIAVAARSLSSEPLAGRVVIVLTDGSDYGSAAAIDEAVQAVKEAGAAVYPIGIEGPKFSPAALKQIARETGGSYYGVKSTASLEQIYAAVAEEFRRTWQLEYVTAVRPGERAALEVSVDGQGKGTAFLAVPKELGGAAASVDGRSGILPGVLYDSAWGRWVFALVVGLIVLVALGVASSMPRGVWLRERLAPHVGSRRPQVRRVRERPKWSGLSALYSLTERAFGSKRTWGKVQRLLRRADVPLRTVEFMYLVGASGIVAALVASAAQVPPVAIAAAFGAGVLAPLAVVSLKARRRTRAFDDQLPDLLITLAASLKAGHSFRHSIQTLVEEGAPPASTEFKRVLTEARLGRPMDESLAEMAERIGSQEFDYVVTAVTIQKEVGGGLAGLFDMVAETVRSRQQFHRKIRSLTAMGRMSAYVLVGLPFFVAGGIGLLNPEYMEPLYHSSTGNTLIIVGLAMIAVGSLILKKIVSFKG